MAQFRKKPVVIEAFQISYDQWWDKSKWPKWLKAAHNKKREMVGSFYRDLPGVGEREQGSYLYISTLEGELKVICNDWIIRGVKGEIYPCKPDIFEQTYEPV